MKETTIGLFRAWGLPESFKGSKRALRYVNPLEKGIYWYHFSQFIRKRDFERWGACISCDKPLESWNDGDCGHYIAASKCGIDLLFDPVNCNLECSQCNAWDETHLIGYRRGLNKRHGEGTSDELERRYYDYANGGTKLQWPKEKYILLLDDLGIKRKD